MQPTIGRVVHYVSYGTPGGEYSQECRAAIVTEVTSDPDNPDQVGLAVLNPTGMFFNPAVPYNDGGGHEGSPGCLDQTSHGSPFRYCACGWIEPTPVGGTWHWPERT